MLFACETWTVLPSTTTEGWGEPLQSRSFAMESKPAWVNCAVGFSMHTGDPAPACLSAGAKALARALGCHL